MRKNAVAIVLLGAVFLSSLLWASRPFAKAEIPFGSGNLYSKLTSISVPPALAIVTQPLTTSLSAVVKARQSFPISRITRLNVAEGESLRAGEVVAKIDNRLFSIFKRKIESNINMAVAFKKILESKRSDINSALEETRSARSKLIETRDRAITSFSAASNKVSKLRAGLAEKEVFLRQKKSELEAALVKVQEAQSRAEAALRAASALLPSPQKKIATARARAALQGIQTKQTFLNSSLQKIVSAQNVVSQARSISSSRLSEGQQRLSSGLEKIASGLEKIREARSTLKEARTQIDSRIDAAGKKIQAARTGLDIANSLLSDSTIRSSVSGQVIELKLQEGETVFPGQDIAEIADLRHLFVKLYLPETKISSVSIGERVLVSIDGVSRKFEGKVDAVGNKVEVAPTNLESMDIHLLRVLPVTIKVSNESGILKPGLPVDIYLERS